MKWITRERPKIDRIACPWLIRRFIDTEAEIIYVAAERVMQVAAETGGIPFDVMDVEYTHYKDRCTFDYFLKKHKLKDPALQVIAEIVRGADTDRHELAPQSAGLWAISAGLAHNFASDLELLEKGMVIYDALYSWARYHKSDKHVQSPMEQLLASVFAPHNKNKNGKRVPDWVKELQHMIQDGIDASLSLKQLSKDLQIHPAYLSREFSKYFDDLSFGDYIHKLRIDKAIAYLKESDYSLTKIAYLTGFSDQSHFTRIFKKQTGQSPSVYRRQLKVKNRPKS